MNSNQHTMENIDPGIAGKVDTMDIIEGCPSATPFQIDQLKSKIALMVAGGMEEKAASLVAMSIFNLNKK